MTPLRLPLLLLAGTITAGCVGPDPQYQDNPFEEPVAAHLQPPRPQMPAPVTPKPATVKREVTQIAASAEPEAIESDVQVYSADTAPLSVVSAPTLQTEPVTPSAAANPSDEVFSEAQKVGAGGDVESQVELLQQAGAMGNAQAYYELARLYLKGEGVQKDPEAAVGYLTTAVGMGHVEATRVLGWLYLLGTGVDKDIPYGEQLLTKAAESSVRAKLEYGMALTNQRAPHLNQMERGLEMLEQAAAAGDGEAAKAYEKAFSAGPGAQVTQDNGIHSDQAPNTSPGASALQSVSDQGVDLKAKAIAGDAAAIYQYALNVSLGKIAAPEPQFTAYCYFSAASAKGYKPADAEVKALAGVRTLSERSSPGRMDRCIADLNSAIKGS